MSVLLLLVAPPAEYVSAAGYEIGSGRLVPTAAAVVGLTSVVIGGLAVARSGRFGSWRAGAVLALVAGLVSAVVGGLHAVNSAGGLGTGNGLAGAVVAVALGLIGMAVGLLALARSRRYAR
jgi:hypothetical protein